MDYAMLNSIRPSSPGHHLCRHRGLSKTEGPSCCYRRGARAGP